MGAPGLDLLIAVCVIYVAALFALAFRAEQLAGRALAGPWVYTLSLSIYCTAWTFYGAVGFAARSGLEFVTIYLGPSLVLVGWWGLLRRLVRVGRAQRVTSVADMISLRYGKSSWLAALATLVALAGGTPYIALQLQSVTKSFGAFARSTVGPDPRTFGLPDTALSGAPENTALWISAGLAFFTLVFGTRRLDPTERHAGIVAAIAAEAVVKLLAMVAVGLFVIWGINGGLVETFARLDRPLRAGWEPAPGRWMGLITLSALAFLTLPRMFQVLVVENSDLRHLATASWAFPAYLLATSLFVIPIAVTGLDLMPRGADPDLFVLTLPLAQGREGLAMLAFLGGFASATSMVIVAALALATMISNHLVLPLWLGLGRGGLSSPASGLAGMAPGLAAADMRGFMLTVRRVSIVGVLALGWGYLRLSGGGAALASTGILSFAGMAQLAPALLGGLLWHGARRAGAIAGLIVGVALWGWTMLLPVALPETAPMLLNGPGGLRWLRPEALLGSGALDPLVHGLLWSLGLNTLVFIVVSLARAPDLVERAQASAFVEERAPLAVREAGGSTEALLVLAQRILGPAEAQALFTREARAQGLEGMLPVAGAEFLARVERRMAGNIGAATAHAMIARVIGYETLTMRDLMRLADEQQGARDLAGHLQQQSLQARRSAQALARTNAELKTLSTQKDAFLAQISHELRTPMTSVLSFAEILRDTPDLHSGERQRLTGIIHEESARLTRLLDALLDLSVLEAGRAGIREAEVALMPLLVRAQDAALPPGAEVPLRVRVDPGLERVALITDPDRAVQVFVNLISNAAKYCRAWRPQLNISGREVDGGYAIDFIDNGAAIPEEKQALLFEKFARLDTSSGTLGAGLGLALCREIMEALGGQIAYLPGQGGAAFRVTFPRQAPQ